MKIVRYTIKDLKDELCGNNLWSNNIMPITKHRALSYINNPNAKDEDIVLLVAYHNASIIGYIGLIPDRVLINDMEHDIAWATSWWVDPGHRNIGTGGFLLLTALNNYSIATSGSTADADKVYLASRKLTVLRNLNGREIIVRSCSTRLIQKKFPKLSRLRPVMKCIDRVVNRFVELRLFLWKRKTATHRLPPVEFITEIDEQTDQFIKQYRKNELYRRNARELNWIIRYPWILPAPCADNTVSRYFFSSIARRFFYINTKIFDENEKMVGFVMFKVRDNTLTIPYIYYESTALGGIMHLIGYFIIELDIDIFTTYNKEVLTHLDRIKFPYLYRKNRSRLYYISSKFKDIDLGDLDLQDGNGDAVFT